MPETPVATDEPVADPEAPVDAAVSSSAEDAALQEADLLIEDVSIDGMCGVY
jgi:mycofactocin precursor